MHRIRVFALLGVVAALWSLVFAAISTLDYTSHLDRGLHDLHCSFIPGASAVSDAEGCRVALNSPYSSVLKTVLWGGIPISLFGLGCFAFLVGHAAYVFALGPRASRRVGILYFLLAASPAIVSAIMFGIAWFELGAICKTCAGMYVGSLGLLISGFGVIANSWSHDRATTASTFVGTVAGLAGILIATLTPSVVYAALAPDHTPYVTQCGQLPQPKEKHDALLKLPGAAAVMNATFFEDPLCPTCKAVHDRLRLAGTLPRLSIELSLFPLDSECNWMLDQPLHPGACEVSRAVLCAPVPAEMMEWSYANQERLAAAGKQGPQAVAAMVEQRWGKQVVQCMHTNETTQRLNRHLHYAVDNALPVSTPQVFLGGRRLCDEDIDIGLMFALQTLAPEIVR